MELEGFVLHKFTSTILMKQTKVTFLGLKGVGHIIRTEDTDS